MLAPLDDDLGLRRGGSLLQLFGSKTLNGVFALGPFRPRRQPTRSN